MSHTDPIADFLTRIRNALIADHEVVEMPASSFKAERKMLPPARVKRQRASWELAS